MFGLYLHIPFCQHKCSYCDFYSIERMEQMDDFVHMIVREITLRATESSGYIPPASSVFFGGGTPSLLAPQQLDTIINALHRHFQFEPGCEWSMECNPGTTSLESLMAYAASGINRLSFGVQSFHEQELKFLERIHDANEAELAIGTARSAGYTNINLDLMFALPGQTMESYSRSVERALQLNTDHISAYSLIFEEGTPLYSKLLSKEVQATDEDVDLAMYEYTMSTLRSRGFHQYEVSNFAQPGRECRHNQCYWRGDEYLSFGPSAHGYFNNTRYWNARNLGRYLQSLHDNCLPTLNAEVLDQSNRMFERTFLQLRSSGIEIERFRSDFGFDVKDVLLNSEPWLVSDGYLHVDENISLTQKGYSQCDEITLKLISALEKSSKAVWKRVEAASESENDIEIALPVLRVV